MEFYLCSRQDVPTDKSNLVKIQRISLVICVFQSITLLHKIKISLEWYKLIAISFSDAWRKRIFVNFEQYVYRYIWFNNSPFDNIARSDTICNIRRQIVKCEFQQFRCTSWPLVPSRSHFQPSCTSLSTRQLVSLNSLSNFPYRNSRLVLETNNVSQFWFFPSFLRVKD